MSEFQLFVSYKSGDLDPHLKNYICVESSENFLETQLRASEKGTAPNIGVVTSNCFLDLSPLCSVDNQSVSGESFQKAENIDLLVLDLLGYNEAGFKNIPDDIDIILPYPTSWLDSEYMTAVDRHVMWYWWHRRERDFDVLRDIFTHLSPGYLEDLEVYRTEDCGYPLGTFIMNSTRYPVFTAWMQAVVEEFECRQGRSDDVSWVETLAPRIISLHLLAIFVQHLQRTVKGVRVEHLPCRYFEHMESQYLTPAFSVNNVAVVLASDAYYAPLMSVAIESIIRNASESNNYDIIVLENGLTSADFALLQEQVSGRNNFSLRILHLRGYLANKGLPTLAHISVTAFARFLILDFLAAYSKVIYLDTDLVCTTDIAELYETDVEGYLVAAVRDTADAGWSNIVGNNTRNHIESVVELEDVYNYFNSGVLVMNIDAFLGITSCRELLEMSLDKKWIWVDQDILNHMCVGKVKYLDQAWNCMAHKETYFTPETTPEIWLPVWLQKSYQAAHDAPKIVHYVGRATPCFSLYSDLAWYFWEYARTSPYYEILMCIASAEMESDPLNPVSRIRKERQRIQAIGPLVSLIVPVYNSAAFLPELFDSLLRQTHENIEVICVNDGSTDNSLEILRKYADGDKRIVVVDKENSGAGATRNLGMDYIRGKYVCFVDSDDFLEEDAIEQLVRVAEDNETDVVVFGMDQYDDKTGLFVPNPWAVSRSRIPIRKVFFAGYVDNFYKYLVGFTVNKFYRSSFLLGLNLRFPAIGAHEDMPFTYIALSAAARTYYLDKTLYHYRRSREGSLSDSTSDRYIYMLEALLCLKEGLLERGLWPDYERNFVSYVLHMCIWKHGELSRFERIEFRDTCRGGWFERLSVLGRESNYFFDQEDCYFFEDTVNMSFSRKLVAKCYRRRLLKNADEG